MEVEEFTQDQIEEIEAGKEAGLNTAVYENPAYLAIQMQEIRLGLMQSLNVSVYADPAYDWYQMQEIRLGLEHHVNVRKYADPGIPFMKMRQLRKGLEHNIDLTKFIGVNAGLLREIRKAYQSNKNITPYLKEGYNEEQIREIRKALVAGIDIHNYITPEMRGQVIAEIRYGLEDGIVIDKIRFHDFDWHQMREIRLGLEEHLPVEYYENPLFSWRQMYQIRDGLAEEIDVSSFANLMYTEKEMEIRKKRLMSMPQGELPDIGSGTTVFGEYTVMIMEGQMSAYVMPHVAPIRTPREQLLKDLQASGITEGIIKAGIDQLLSKAEIGSMVLVASGTPPKVGERGYYEYFFNYEENFTPNIEADGTVDYSGTKWFEEVKKGQRIAVYHRSTFGEPGKTVTGHTLRGERGEELRMLKGTGFTLADDKRTYYATRSGMIERVEDRILITEMMIVDQVDEKNHKLDFEGSIHIHGDVISGAVIRAAKDLYIDGVVAGATLEAGQNIVLAKGCNAAGKGRIIADKNVYAKFLENVSVKAKDTIVSSSALNCFMTAGEKVLIEGGHGVLAGGRCVAGKNIIVQQLGNPGGARTFIALDGKMKVDRRLASQKQTQEEMKQQLSALSETYQKLSRMLSPEQKASQSVYQKLEKSISEQQQELENIEREIRRTMEQRHEFADSEINVKEQIYEGCVVAIGENKWESRDLSSTSFMEREGRISVVTSREGK